MASVVYNSAKKKLADGSIDLDTDTIKVMLVDSSYSPNIDSHSFKSDITHEVSGTGYTAGGKALTSAVVTQDNTGDRAYFDAADTTWTGATFTARGAVIYKDTGTAATSPVLCYIDFGADKSAAGDSFTIQWSTSGILQLA